MTQHHNRKRSQAVVSGGSPLVTYLYLDFCGMKSALSDAVLQAVVGDAHNHFVGVSSPGL